MPVRVTVSCVAGLVMAVGSGLAWSHGAERKDGYVVITPLGAQAGELCAADRAMLLEDPSGVNILIQPGRTVYGSADTRLADVHVVLLDHAHGNLFT